VRPHPGGLVRRAVPHREPMLLVDRLEELVPGRRGRGVRQVSGADAHREGAEQGGWEGDAAAEGFPVTLLADALGQVAIAVLAGGETPGVWYLATLEGFEVESMALPGDELVLEAEVGRGFRGSHRVEVRASVEDRTVVSGSMVLVEGERREEPR
jgi:3-hydroxyacyl-[acyl-carrier-protein] dehydratase